MRKRAGRTHRRTPGLTLWTASLPGQGPGPGTRGLPGGLIEGSGTLVGARTAGFTVLVLAQLFNCFNARSERTSAFHHLFVNPLLWGAVGLSLVLQVLVVHVPGLNTAFATSPLSVEQWLVCAAMASAVLWASEVRKLVSRAASRAR